MPTAIHRITKELRQSADPHVIDQAWWICPADLALVEHLPVWRWVIDGDLVRAPTSDEAAEQDAIRLTSAKAAKIAAIDARSPELLSSGVLVNGESISCSLAAQNNLNSLNLGLLIGRTQFPLGISTVSGGEHQVPNAKELERISTLVWNRVSTVLAQGRSLRLAVLAAETIAEVEAVEDSRV